MRISPAQAQPRRAVDPRQVGERALNELTFSPKRIAKEVKKVLQSAIANAENNHDLDVDDLVVTEASVGKNLVMKRFHARARGHAGGIEKFFSQITIVVEEEREGRSEAAKEAKCRRRRQEAVGKAAAKKRGQKRRRRKPDGSESQSDRAAPRHQPHLGLALVSPARRTTASCCRKTSRSASI